MHSRLGRLVTPAWLSTFKLVTLPGLTSAPTLKLACDSFHPLTEVSND